MKTISAKAPTRIDLGGGTLDIWPLYLLHDSSCTINMAINLFVEAELIPHESGMITIRLDELNETSTVRDIPVLPSHGAFGLINNILKHFCPDFGFDLTIQIKTPPGSGLGTSSSLALVLCKIFSEATHQSLSDNDLLQRAMNLETQIIQLPTGNQDYLAALYGGINAWHYDVRGWHRECFPVSHAEIEQRTILCYVGKPHDSGLSNWVIVKKRMEKDQKIINQLEEIKNATCSMRQALLNSDWNSLCLAINLEWDNRKKLSSLILVPEMEQALSAAFQAGCIAAKGCGAANGGSILFFVPPEKKHIIRESLLKAHVEILDFSIVSHGLISSTKN
jgi:D-glycero-alpha-D-manno-heptose-7-phosphate kinase